MVEFSPERVHPDRVILRNRVIITPKSSVSSQTLILPRNASSSMGKSDKPTVRREDKITFKLMGTDNRPICILGMYA